MKKIVAALERRFPATPRAIKAVAWGGLNVLLAD
jgi:hypothetical protein